MVRGNGWAKDKSGVVAELRNLRDEVRVMGKALERVQERVVSLNVDLARLNVKASIWGALAGVLTAIGAALLAKYGG